MVRLPQMVGWMNSTTVKARKATCTVARIHRQVIEWGGGRLPGRPSGGAFYATAGSGCRKWDRWAAGNVRMVILCSRRGNAVGDGMNRPSVLRAQRKCM